ncbi:DUF6414 family protein [Klebsiella pneumoniae]
MEQEQQKIDSLYDFLYVDRVRASSLTAQLYGPGVATAIKMITSDIDKSTKGVGFDIKVLKANTSVEEAINHTQEKQFDATWSLPINLLDQLNQAGMIRNGLNGEQLGNTVAVQGNMRIFDISMLQKSIPFMIKLYGNQQQKSPQKNQKKTNDPDNIEVAPGITLGMVSELLNIVPNTLQVDFIDKNGNTIWMTINREYLTINPDDMFLKYGGRIPGDWFVVGLIDALPEVHQNNHPLHFPVHPVKDGIAQMLNAIKALAGRGEDSYGITPLVIFRKMN